MGVSRGGHLWSARIAKHELGGQRFQSGRAVFVDVAKTSPDVAMDLARKALIATLPSRG